VEMYNEDNNMRSKSTFGKINTEEPMHYIAATHSSLVDSCKQWKS